MIFTLIFISFVIDFSSAVPECPRFSVAFDYQSCDPTKRSQCPGGFTCRKGNDSTNPSKNMFLCCDSSVMSVEDWFTEADLVPQVFPQNPVNKIKSIQLTPVEPGTEFPSVHIGDEVVVLSYPTYLTGMVDKMTFSPVPAAGGYLHYMTVVDPGYHPYAIFFLYNQPSLGMATVSIGSTTNNRIAFVDNSSSVPLRDSYRAHYVVLAFRTPRAISLDQTNRIMTNNPYAISTPDAKTMMNGCSDVTCLLSNTTLGRDLGEPFAGTMFYLTTRRTIYETKNDGKTENSATGTFFFLSLIALHIIIS